MKQLIPILFVVMILATGCPQPAPEIHNVEIGLFTPYVFMPETLNGKIREVTEKNYLAVEEDGQYVKGERLTVKARDSISWTNDFRVKYDEAGNLLLFEALDENDQVIESNTTTVEEGKIVKSENMRDDTLRTYMRVIYNEAGQISKFEQFRLPADTLLWSLGVAMDENGSFTEWQFYNPADEPTGKYLFTTSQEGKRTGYSYYNTEGEKTFEQKFTYNENGFMSRQELINREGEVRVSEYEYEYDEMGNWIKVTGNSDELKLIAERTITYYGE